MGDQDFVLGSGARLHVSMADFRDAKALTKALIKTVGGIKLSDDLMNMDVTVLKDIVVNAVTSDEVESYLMRCMERATYNDVKITAGLFDDPQFSEKLRGDYAMIGFHVIKVNCAPFFDQALSMLKTFQEKRKSNPKSE